MGRSLFIGDSHTCGYYSIPGKTGLGSYSYWNDNIYSERYGDLFDKPVVTYAQAGVYNRVYTDWLKSMFERYDDIDEVFICLAPLNRFVISYDSTLRDEALPVDHFTMKMDNSPLGYDRFIDQTISDGVVQLFNKPTYDDYSTFVGFDLSQEEGLKSPNLRKNSFMQVKLFHELNTYQEKRDFLNYVYTWDNICNDNNANLYIFHFSDRGRYPSKFDYYGSLKRTIVSPKTVQSFFKSKMIDHEKYLIEDKEHYNKEFHEMIAEKFLPWIKSLKS
jgi:hypothetical protein